MTDYSLPEEYKPTKEILEFEKEKRESGKIGVLVPGGKGNIPVLYSKGKSLAEAWENSMINLWVNGVLLRTQYDKKNKQGEYIEPPSKDCSMTVIIEEPFSEPMIHKCFPGGIEDLEEYRQEVVDGIKDSWIRDKKDPLDTRWEYTYHERMFKYKVPGIDEMIDQYKIMVNAIAKSPITRRSQMISWQPWEDLNIADPACWQSLWGRILRDSMSGTKNIELYSDDSGQAYLNLNMRFRSRDGFGASFMNDYGFLHLAKQIAEDISKIRGEEVKLARFVDQSDSFHIYGKDYGNFVGIFLNGLFNRTFEKRTYNLNDPMIQAIIEESKPKIKSKVEGYNQSKLEEIAKAKAEKNKE